MIAVHCLTHATGKHKKLLDDVFGNRTASENDVASVYDLFRELGSVDYAQQRALSFVNQAKDAITVLKPSDAKELLYQLIEYAVQREK